MDLVETWLKTNKPTKCPDCYTTPDRISEYEKTKQFKEKRSKPRKTLNPKALERETKLLSSIQ